MQHVLRKSTLASAISILCLSLAACHSNPLLSDDNISKIKADMPDRYFTDNDARPCANYYASGATKAELKTRCDSWSASFYKVLINDGTISYKATLEDFRDPALWKILKEQ